MKNLSDVENGQMYKVFLDDLCESNNIDATILLGATDIDFDVVHVYGIQLDPVSFVERAIKMQHPRDLQQAIPKELKEAIDARSEMSCLQLAQHRLAYVLKWNKRAKQLAGDETALKNGMDPVVTSAVKNKRILLFREMLKDLQFPDMNAVNELQHGADLTGDVEETGMLPKKFVPALLSNDMLERQSEICRSKFEVKCRGSGDSDIDEAVWSQTLEEVEKGWLLGPYNASDIDCKTPISRRFGVRQGEKVRPIDS